MTIADWYVEGPEFGGCVCSFGCPCQFEALPTHGHCRGFEVLRIDKGHFEEIDLSGLKVAMLYAWPGPIFEGKGELQAVIDERADAKQREVLVKILHGEETEEAATHWWVFNAMSDTIHDPLFKPIDYEIDIEARTARVAIPGVLESTGTPIRPPHSDGEHRAKILIPNGIEFELAEVGSASTRTAGDSKISLDFADCYGQFNMLHHSGSGIVHA